VPTHAVHGPLKTLKHARVVPHDGDPQGLGHRGIEQPITLTDQYLVGRPFVVRSAGSFERRPHREQPRRYPAQPLRHVRQRVRSPDPEQVLAPSVRPRRGTALRQRMPAPVDDSGGSCRRRRTRFSHGASAQSPAARRGDDGVSFRHLGYLHTPCLCVSVSPDGTPGSGEISVDASYFENVITKITPCRDVDYWVHRIAN